MTINWDDFNRVDIRVGTIVRVEEFPEAKKPAYKLWIDFGELGVKQSSVQITELYKRENLPGRRVVAVVNFSPKQIGPFISEVLTTGFADSEGRVVLAVPDGDVPDGARLF